MLYDKRWDAPATKEGPVVNGLKRARGFVERGWCQHMGADAKGNVCMSGALNRATCHNHSAYLRGEVDAVRFAVVKAIGWENIPAWNDRPGRTKEEVLAAIDRAIEIARCDP